MHLSSPLKSACPTMLQGGTIHQDCSNNPAAHKRLKQPSTYEIHFGEQLCQLHRWQDDTVPLRVSMPCSKNCNASCHCSNVPDSKTPNIPKHAYPRRETSHNMSSVFMAYLWHEGSLQDSEQLLGISASTSQHAVFFLWEIKIHKCT